MPEYEKGAFTARQSRKHLFNDQDSTILRPNFGGNSRSGLIKVSSRNRCPICNKPDWCGIAKDGSLAVCMRVEDGALRESRNGGFVHVLKESEYKAWPNPIHTNVSQSATLAMAAIGQRHAVYTALLESLTLTGRHGDDLLRRGLHDTFIANNLFASVPGQSKAKIVCAVLTSRFDLSGIPGFFRQGDGWRLAVGNWCAGYFVPVRDLAGRIQALQIRRDRGDSRYVWLSSKEKLEGTTSGAPVHFAASHRLRQGNVIITEGALKADVIAQFTECAVIGLAGVNSYKAKFGVALKAAGVRAVQIAFDADWQKNLAVSKRLERLGPILRDAGLKVSLLDWSLSEGKGLDDVLAKEVLL